MLPPGCEFLKILSPLECKPMAQSVASRIFLDTIAFWPSFNPMKLEWPCDPQELGRRAGGDSSTVLLTNQPSREI
jgi:hypothetical protein